MRNPCERLEADETLIQLAATGERAAFDALCLRHLPRLFVVALRITNDPAVAEEIAQETMLRAWREKDRFDPARGRLVPWLNRIALNLALDCRRGTKAVTQIPEDLPALIEDPEVALSRSDVGSALAQGVAALPVRQRAAVLLTYLGERSGRDAADILGVSPRALEGLLHRARLFLRDWLAARGI
ncbi:MAG: sigma-70 family RNA polymerase sigma factor [Acetobacteraceae bacterium]|nr:sigma-70 family RNA polymerase sigma factor [Acetobacteraceae bacterium]